MSNHQDTFDSPIVRFGDLYSVSPKNMSDEQIALRDAMTVTAVDQAENVTAVCGTLHSLLDGLCKSVERLERERDEMRGLLKEIFEQSVTETRKYSAIVPKQLIDRAKLLAGG